MSVHKKQSSCLRFREQTFHQNVIIIKYLGLLTHLREYNETDLFIDIVFKTSNPERLALILLKTLIWLANLIEARHKCPQFAYSCKNRLVDA